MAPDIIREAALTVNPDLVVDWESLRYNLTSGLWEPKLGRDLPNEALYFDVTSEIANASLSRMESQISMFYGIQTRVDRQDVNNSQRLAAAMLVKILLQLKYIRTPVGIGQSVQFTAVRIKFAEEFAGYQCRFALTWQLSDLVNKCC